MDVTKCAWLSCAAVQCLLEVLLQHGNSSVKPVIQDVTLAVIMQHAPTLRVIYTLGDALPVLLTSQTLTVGVHYVLVTDVSLANKTLVFHDPKDHSSTCGAWFWAIMSKMGWSVTWHHYGTQPDSDTCGFCVVMLAMQWCHTNRLTGQLPRWFFTYCESFLQLFADDMSSLRSTVNTFQDWAYEDALREYDEPVDWAMTEGGPLPTVTNIDMEAAILGYQYMASSLSNSASGPSSTSNHPLPPHLHICQPVRSVEQVKGLRGQPHEPHRQKPRLQEEFQSGERQICPHVPQLANHHPTGHTVNHLPRVDKRPTQLLATTPRRSGRPTPSPGRGPRRAVHRTTKSLILDARDQLRAVLPIQQAKSLQRQSNDDKKLR